jgi:hypothetical protein
LIVILKKRDALGHLLMMNFAQEHLKVESISASEAGLRGLGSVLTDEEFPIRIYELKERPRSRRNN